MAISTETVGRLLASGRNYASTFVGFVGGIGLMSAAQQKGFMDAINEIINGLSQVFHGATSLWQILIVAFPIIGVAMAKLASNSAKKENQAAAVVAASPGTKIVTPDKAFAEAVPSPAVVSTDEAKVVSK